MLVALSVFGFAIVTRIGLYDDKSATVQIVSQRQPVTAHDGVLSIGIQLASFRGLQGFLEHTAEYEQILSKERRYYISVSAEQESKVISFDEIEEKSSELSMYRDNELRNIAIAKIQDDVCKNEACSVELVDTDYGRSLSKVTKGFGDAAEVRFYLTRNGERQYYCSFSKDDLFKKVADKYSTETSASFSFSFEDISLGILKSGDGVYTQEPLRLSDNEVVYFRAFGCGDNVELFKLPQYQMSGVYPIILDMNLESIGYLYLGYPRIGENVLLDLKTMNTHKVGWFGDRLVVDYEKRSLIFYQLVDGTVLHTRVMDIDSRKYTDSKVIIDFDYESAWFRFRATLPTFAM
ncbi:MAG: hypothetical protein ACOY3E_13740 [Pseudomonadota bacterium]